MTETLLHINGEQRQFQKGSFPSTIGDLLNTLDIAPETVVAELEGQIIEKKNFNSTQLHPGQKIELVRFVGGG
jgi:sulfur carrier protein